MGYATPRGIWREFIKAVRERVPNIEKAVISVHCHNDLGLAVANTLAALKLGPQVEVAMNSIGERAGNASLESSYGYSPGGIYLEMERPILRQKKFIGLVNG